MLPCHHCLHFRAYHYLLGQHVIHLQLLALLTARYQMVYSFLNYSETHICRLLLSQRVPCINFLLCKTGKIRLLCHSPYTHPFSPTIVIIGIGSLLCPHISTHTETPRRKKTRGAFNHTETYKKIRVSIMYTIFIFFLNLKRKSMTLSLHCNIWEK